MLDVQRAEVAGGHGECALEQQPVQHQRAGIRTGGGCRSLHLDAPAHVRTQPGGDEPTGHATPAA